MKLDPLLHTAFRNELKIYQRPICKGYTKNFPFRRKQIFVTLN
jgi:hypothetical protein